MKAQLVSNRIPGFLPIAPRPMVISYRTPLYRQALALAPSVRIGQAQPALLPGPTLEQLKAEKLAVLRTGAFEILNTATKVAEAVNRTYLTYRDQATSSTWARILAFATGPVGATVWTWIQGDANKEALVRLVAARRLGNQWINAYKAKWFIEEPPPEVISLQAELIKEDEPLSVQVDDAFDNVVIATGNITSLIGEIQGLPETVIYQGVTTFFNQALKSTENMIIVLGNVMDAMAKLTAAIAAALAAAGRTAEKFPEIVGTVAIVAGLGLIAYFAFK